MQRRGAHTATEHTTIKYPAARTTTKNLTARPLVVRGNNEKKRDGTRFGEEWPAGVSCHIQTPPHTHTHSQILTSMHSMEVSAVVGVVRVERRAL